MKQEDIIRMAREAGFVEYELEDYTQSGYDIRYERFAALVAAASAAAENEACAQVCDAYGQMGLGANSAANAIRARSET